MRFVLFGPAKYCKKNGDKQGRRWRCVLVSQKVLAFLRDLYHSSSSGLGHPINKDLDVE
jgi:hypothetical protein